MEANRGKKGRKSGWQLVLGLKEVFFAGIGVAGLMVLTFTLGTLAGRGDIYRLLHHWGLLAAEAPKVAQPWLPPGWAPPGAAPDLTAGSPSSPAVAPPAAAPAPVALSPAAAQPASAAPAAAQGSPPPPAPVKGSIAAVPGSGTKSPAKKSKGGALAREQKAKEEELRRIRQEVVSKLKFQNSLDTTPKPARLTQKQTKEKTGVARPQPTLVKVAQFRDGKAARAKLAEWQKKGEKVCLKQGKDQQGVYYVIYRQSASKPGEAKSVARGSNKSRESKRPAQGESGR
jgi:hypothetical protein